VTDKQDTQTAGYPPPTDPRTDAERARDAWNLRHPIGTPVVATLLDGTELNTATYSPAHLLATSARVFVHGVVVALPLARVRAVSDEPALDGAA